jgi:penicillin amidase
MRALQHDTAAELYWPYRDLAVSALTGRRDGTGKLLAEWNGYADVDSRAFGVLVRLREILAQRVLSPYLSVCRNHDPAFEYPFRSIDRPLLAILNSRDPSLLPCGEERGSWSGFVGRCVDRAVADLSTSTGRAGLPQWGELNSLGLSHPLEGLAPWSGSLLGVAPKPQSGALHSVRTCVPGFSAVGRAVLSPGPDGLAVFEMPGGQSGDPLSANFDDRHDQWSSTVSGPERPGRFGCVSVLRPASPWTTESSVAGRTDAHATTVTR